MRTRNHPILAAGLILGLAVVAPLRAQEAAAPDPEALSLRVIWMLDEGQARLWAGQIDEALRLFNAANDLTFQSDTLDGLIKHRPNLYQARYYREVGAWELLERYASSVASALDSEATRDHPFRIEAIFYQAIAASRLGRSVEAEQLFRRTVAASAGRPELLRIHEDAVFWLAEVAYLVTAEDRAALRSQALDDWYPGHAATASRYAYLAYLDLLDARINGMAPDVLLPLVQTFVDNVSGRDDISAQHQSLYKGFLGFVLLLAQEYEAALPILEERHDFMIENELWGLDFFWNIQRLALALGARDGLGAELRMLETWVARGEELQSPDWQIGLLTEQIGDLRQELGDTEGAQAAYRDAYLWLRRGHVASDEDVMRIAARIDLAHPALDSFPLRHELVVDETRGFALDPLGSDVVRMFFEGNWKRLEQELDRLRAQGQGDTPMFLLNEALYLSILGRYDEAQAALDRARGQARQAQGGELAPNAMIFDMVDAVAKVWGTGHRKEQARGPLDRLKARAAGMTRAERSVYLALEVFYYYRSSDFFNAPQAVTRWLDNYDPDSTKTIWEVYAATMVLEAAYSSVGDASALKLMQTLLHDLDAHPTLEMAQTYVRLVHRLNSSTALFGDGALTEYGAMVQRLSAQVPHYHSLLTATQFGLAGALSWRGRHEEALEWMIRATDSVRAAPYREPDLLAYLLSEQAKLLMHMGQYNRAALLAREAFDTVDLYTGRSDLVAGILETHVQAMAFRQGDYTEATEVLGRYIDDIVFFGRLPEANRISMLASYTAMLVNTGGLDEVRAVVERAEALIPEDFNDWRPIRSQLAWNRAIAEYWSDAPGAGFEMMRRSNDLYFDWLDDMLASGATDEIVQQNAHDRATWEAAIAWDYAQTLPD